jgi:hypothetical protein
MRKAIACLHVLTAVSCMQLAYSTPDWIDQPMMNKRYDLKLKPAGAGLLKSMGKVASCE